MKEIMARGDIKQKKELSKQLEDENRRMEERLQELRMAMSKEKEERQISGGGNFWSKGKPGAVLSYKLDTNEQGNKKPKKLTVLKNEPISVPKRQVQPGTMAYLAQQKDSDKPASTSNRIVRSKGPKCGQCEDKPAAVICQECSEEYCAKCFAVFHLRGALKKHRTIPISNMGPARTSVITSQRSVQSRADEESKTSSNSSTLRAPDQRSLDQPDGRVAVATCSASAGDSERVIRVKQDAEDHYNEARAAQEFKEAVMDWRRGAAGDSPHQVAPPPPVVKKTSQATDTVFLEPPRKEDTLHIEFTPSLNYAEQLMLKKHRRSELASYNNSNGAAAVDKSKEDPTEQTITFEEVGTTIFPTSSRSTTKRQQHKNSGQYHRATKSPTSENNSALGSVAPPPDAGSEFELTGTFRPRSEVSQYPATPRSNHFSRGYDYERPVSRAKTSIGARREGGHLTSVASLGLSQVAALAQGYMPTYSGDEATSLLTFGLPGAGEGTKSTTPRPSSAATPGATPRSARPKSARLASAKKLSYKFYKVGPCSWKPDQSLYTAAGTLDDVKAIAEAWPFDTTAFLDDGVGGDENDLSTPRAAGNEETTTTVVDMREQREELSRIVALATTPRLQIDLTTTCVVPRRLRSAHGRPLPARKSNTGRLIQSARQASRTVGIVVDGDDMTRFDSHHPEELEDERESEILLHRELSINAGENQGSCFTVDNYYTNNHHQLVDSLDLTGTMSEDDDDDTLRTGDYSVRSSQSFNEDNDEALDALDSSRCHDHFDVVQLQ